MDPMKLDPRVTHQCDNCKAYILDRKIAAHWLVCPDVEAEKSVRVLTPARPCQPIAHS